MDDILVSNTTSSLPLNLPARFSQKVWKSAVAVIISPLLDLLMSAAIGEKKTTHYLP